MNDNVTYAHLCMKYSALANAGKIDSTSIFSVYQKCEIIRPNRLIDKDDEAQTMRNNLMAAFEEIETATT